MMLLIGVISYSQEKTKEAVIVTSENTLTHNNVSHNYIVAEAYRATNAEQMADLDLYVFTVYNPISLFSDDEVLANTELID